MKWYVPGTKWSMPFYEQVITVQQRTAYVLPRLMRSLTVKENAKFAHSPQPRILSWPQEETHGRSSSAVVRPVSKPHRGDAPTILAILNFDWVE